MGKFKAKIKDRVVLSDKALKSHRMAHGTKTGVVEEIQVLQNRATYVVRFPNSVGNRSHRISQKVGLFSHEFNTLK